MLSYDIQSLLANNSIVSYNIYFADSDWRLPDKSWIEQEFSKTVKSIFDAYGLCYRLESWDCDDFTRFTAALAQLLNNRTPDNRGKGLAIGEFWYQKDSGTRHALNICIVETEDKPVVLFYEPQTQRFVVLTEQERSLCDYVRF